MLKVLFLDIDGVLNSQDFFNKRYDLIKDGIHPNYPYTEFDPLSIKELNRILDNTDAKLVVSSSWRHDPNLNNTFKEVGISHDIFDITPYLGNVDRGFEIEKFIKDNNVEVYAILDDDTDMLDSQLTNFFKTNAYSNGLNSEIADKVIEHLNKI